MIEDTATSIPSNGIFIQRSPQILQYGNPIINDTLNWIKVGGIFTARGGEQYITIGNFNDDNTTDTVFVDSTGWNGGIAYYYIDDVSVMLCSDTTGINEIKSFRHEIIYHFVSFNKYKTYTRLWL